MTDELDQVLRRQARTFSDEPGIVGGDLDAVVRRSGTRHRVRLAGLSSIAVVLVAIVALSVRSPEPSNLLTAPGTATSTPTGTDAPPTTGAMSGTTASTTPAPTTTATRPATLPPSTVTIPATPAPPPTTTAPAAAPVQIRLDGLGAATYGQPMSEVVATLTRLLGPPDYDGTFDPLVPCDKVRHKATWGSRRGSSDAALNVYSGSLPGDDRFRSFDYETGPIDLVQAPVRILATPSGLGPANPPRPFIEIVSQIRSDFEVTLDDHDNGDGRTQITLSGPTSKLDVYMSGPPERSTVDRFDGADTTPEGAC